MSTKTEKTIDEQKREWQKKYGEGNCRELIADGKSVFVFDPIVDFSKIKAVFEARKKSARAMVDAVLNNCWLGGDEDLKKDEAFKLGVEDQVDEMVDIPEATHVELPNGNISLTSMAESIEIRKITRGDLSYAEDRNTDRKALMTSVYILERVALDQKRLDEIRKKVRVYVSMLLVVWELKDKKYVEVKKF